jgi:polyhydroxyalkanoate synthesis regulator protein
MTKAFGGTTTGFNPVEDMVRRNMEMFERAFTMFLPSAQKTTAGFDKPADTPTESSQEINNLKRQMGELQKKLDQIADKGDKS